MKSVDYDLLIHLNGKCVFTFYFSCRDWSEGGGDFFFFLNAEGYD